MTPDYYLVSRNELFRPQQSRAAPGYINRKDYFIYPGPRQFVHHRFVGQASIGPSRFQSDWSKTFIERALSHLIEIHVVQ